MRILSIFIASCLSMFCSSAQNLINNPSFEEYSSCPPDGPNLVLNIHLKLWQTTIFGLGINQTSYGGYNHLDCNSMTLFINQIAFDSILPFDGKGIVRTPTYSRLRNSNSIRIHGYLFSKLKETLQKDSVYKVSYYIHSNRHYGITDHIGAIFVRDTSDLLYTNFGDTISMVVRDDFIGFRDTFYGPDKLYHKIEGCFTAKGDENYIVFGGFLPPDQVHWHPHLGFLNSNGSGFNLDAVSVTKATKVQEKNQTIDLCDGETFALPLPTNPNTTIVDTLGNEVTTVTIEWPNTYRYYYEDACYGRLGQIDITSNICNNPVDTTITICNNEPLSLLGAVGQPYSIVDEDGKDVTSFISDVAGRFTFSVIHPRYGEFGQIKINVVTCENCSIHVPNILSTLSTSPNNLWQPKTNCVFEEYEVGIFDRWGNKIFHSIDPLISWDGTFSGKPCLTGVYVYTIKYKFRHPIIPQETKYKYGDVSIIK